MTYTPHEIIQVSLNPQEYDLAYGFAVEQDTPKKGKKVYLNTLAILAIHNFLEWLGIETNLDLSDSWNPAVRYFHDVADLVIPNLGKLECRPVLVGENVISLPVEVTEDRIAYVAVQFQEQLNAVQLLGFSKAIEPQPEEIEIANLEPIETLIDYIDHLESALESNTIKQLKIISLSKWLQNINDIYDDAWQKIDGFIKSLENNQVPRFAGGMRSHNIESESLTTNVSKIKEITLGKYLLALMIKCQLRNDEKIDITIKLCPILVQQVHLPFGIEIVILDESGDVFLSTQVQSSEPWIQVGFSGMEGESFSIKVGLEDVNIIENFVI